MYRLPRTTDFVPLPAMSFSVVKVREGKLMGLTSLRRMGQAVFNEMLGVGCPPQKVFPTEVDLTVISPLSVGFPFLFT